MKKLIIVGVALLTGIINTRCTSAEEEVETTEQHLINGDKELDRSIVESQSAVKVYQMAAHKKLNESNYQLTALKQKVGTESESTSTGYLKKTEDLQLQIDLMKLRLDSYQFENRTKWEAFKKEFNTELNQLADTLRAWM